MTLEEPQTLITGSPEEDVIEETPLEVIAPITEDEVEQEVEPEIEVTAEECQMLYGVVLETAHSVIGTRKGKGHRELPEARRIAQGKILHNICKKYNIKIPTELELVIFGGSMIADWQYMGSGIKDKMEDIEDETEQKNDDSN